MTAPRTALFISPHLDDVAFSCGGLACLLADGGWHVVMATMFTRSVVPAKGFALACQLDKGLSETVDYMALRREEDASAVRILGVAHHWIDLPEAPHRGYETPAALFGEVRPDDEIAFELIPTLQKLARTYRPEIVLAPQSLGRHVDHQIVTMCTTRVFDWSQLAFYRDAPYVMRDHTAAALAGAAGGMRTAIDISATLDRKIAASAAYVTQIGFQFGNTAALDAALRKFALLEGDGTKLAETFQGCPITI